MSEIVNLNRARKAKARAKSQSEAAQNRIAFGLSKAEKNAALATRAKCDANLDGHKRER